MPAYIAPQRSLPPETVSYALRIASPLPLEFATPQGHGSQGSRRHVLSKGPRSKNRDPGPVLLARPSLLSQASQLRFQALRN